jgi:hypothetical protein
LKDAQNTGWETLVYMDMISDTPYVLFWVQFLKNKTFSINSVPSMKGGKLLTVQGMMLVSMLVHHFGLCSSLERPQSLQQWQPKQRSLRAKHWSFWKCCLCRSELGWWLLEQGHCCRDCWSWCSHCSLQHSHENLSKLGKWKLDKNYNTSMRAFLFSSHVM